MVRLLRNGVITFLSVAVALYAWVVYALLPVGAAVDPAMRAEFTNHAAAVYVHAFAAGVALLLGPAQFWARLRRERPVLHRWSGRFYLAVGTLVGGLSGLYLAAFAFGGPAARLGFGVLAIVWLTTGWRAYSAIRRGAVVEHQRWMVRNFALAFAAVTLRIYVPLAVVSGVPFATAYPVIAWLCWVPNLLIAEWLWNRSPSAPYKSPRLIS